MITLAPANDQILYPKITIADFDLDIPHSAASSSRRPDSPALDPSAPGSQFQGAL